MENLTVTIDRDQLLRILLTSAANRLRSRGYRGENAAAFANAINDLFESTKKEIQSECVRTLANARANGADSQDFVALALALFATAGVDIADRAIRERVSSN